ncbi:type IX secretion system sortase PorU [Carboxylicivirga linearis]|uniref:Type IX secretion system sortase PorU n=1 Tax=Carboxylicivirga linearis TaxID=1628157 RepID=A0ABS5JY20_9BACT|nr:type IX secretion system sortase PorU [Carboxylicivirga linearis]MBS2099773.1 type IX secretion system sortase PorU [Carboxylicivirga linearis]
MVRIITIGFICFLLTFGLEAQSLKENLIINWNTFDESQSYMSFSNQAGETEEGLPLMLWQYPIENNYVSIDDIEVFVTPKEKQALSSKETLLIKDVDLNSVKLIEKDIVTIRKKKFLEVSIVPLAYDEQLQVYNRITKLQLQINIPDKDSSNSTLKSSINKTVTSNSVLSSGRWIKVSISESGVHKIPYSTLTTWGFSSGQNVKVFGNGGNMLPKSNSTDRYDDLQENAVMHYNNAIYFYAQGPTTWKYDGQRDMFVHQIHDYTDEAYYFLTEDVGVGKTVQTTSDMYDSFTNETDEYDSYTYYELELYNLIHSGRTWYGERIEVGRLQNYDFKFSNLNTEKPLKLLTSVIGRSNTGAILKTFINGSGNPLQEITIPSVDYSTTTGSWANSGIAQSSFYSNGSDVSVGLLFNTSANGAFGNLNYLTLNAKEYLTLNNQLEFRNKDVVGEGNVTRFYLDNTNSNTVLWDITDHIDPVKIELESYGNKKGFTASTDKLKEFIVFDPLASLPQPSMVEEVANQDLHSVSVPDMLIVVHPLFKEQANRLAELHNQNSGLECLIVEPQQIYNEFSSGQPDVSAIRDFARFLYQKDDKFKYLLLFGNGSYDNKSNDEDNTNFILTYQSENSTNITNSYTSDDFFGFLDEGEGGGSIQKYKLDIGIGRFPVNSQEQAKIVVDKIENYLFNPLYSNWKSTLTFVGDDGDNNLHMRQAESLTQKVMNEHPEFDITKIYLDAYKKETNISGGAYPDVNIAIQEALNQGTLIFNYTGHGGENQLAHENILDRTDIEKLTNTNRLPLFVTATCEFSRYDKKDLTEGSAGEKVIVTPNGGGIGLLTTTRVAWSSSNFNLNNNLYNYIFEKDTNGEKLRLGDIIRETKNASSTTINKLNFTLLGDPALRLNYPVNSISIDKINGESDPAKQDTLKALDLIEIEGVIADGNSSMFEDGLVEVKVFDKPVTVATLGNGGMVPFEYELYQNRIYRGDVNVNNDHFSVSFMVPKDIRYNVGNGRISFYGSDANQVEAFGANNNIKVGSITNNPPDDNEGPEITAWLNSEGFKNGDVTGTSPILTAHFFDESGINTSGVGIGHDITLTIDDDRSKSIVLNDYYVSETGDYQRGSLSYQLPTLESGKHVLQLKAWDNVNNSSTIELEFRVEITGELKIDNVQVEPNPVASGETVKVSFDHDAPNSILETTLRLYDLSGRLIDVLKQQNISVGGAVTPFDYKIPSGLQRGVYILHGEFNTDDGQQGVFSKKILVIK